MEQLVRKTQLVFAWDSASAVSSATTSRFPALPLNQTKLSDGAVVSSNSGQLVEAADETLVARVQAGDRDAFALLFRRYAHIVRNIGVRILRDRSEADDLVQEVFLYIHRKSMLFDSSKGSARSWIVQVAYTQGLLRRRKLKSLGFYLSGIADKPPEIESPRNSGAVYDQSAEGLFGKNGWRNVLDALTKEQRETLRLHFFEGYTFAEIAEKLGQSYANVRHHHYRGLQKLRKHLTECELNGR